MITSCLHLCPCRAHRFVSGLRHSPGLAANGCHTCQEIPSQPQRLEGPDLPDPASRSFCGVCHGPGLNQEWPTALSRAGDQPSALQIWPKLLFLQVSPHGKVKYKGAKGEELRQVNRTNQGAFTPSMIWAVQLRLSRVALLFQFALQVLPMPLRLPQQGTWKKCVFFKQIIKLNCRKQMCINMCINAEKSSCCMFYCNLVSCKAWRMWCLMAIFCTASDQNDTAWPKGMLEF